MTEANPLKKPTRRFAVLDLFISLIGAAALLGTLAAITCWTFRLVSYLLELSPLIGE